MTAVSSVNAAHCLLWERMIASGENNKDGPQWTERIKTAPRPLASCAEWARKEIRICNKYNYVLATFALAVRYEYLRFRMCRLLRCFWKNGGMVRAGAYGSFAYACHAAWKGAGRRGGDWCEERERGHLRSSNTVGTRTANMSGFCIHIFIRIAEENLFKGIV